MVGMFVSSIVLLIAVLNFPTNTTIDYYDYGISVASIAMILSFFGFFLNRNEGLNARFGTLNSNLLCLWNVLGAIILTFPGPFRSLTNAYFSVWALAIFSVMAVGITPSQMKDEASGMSAQTGLLACSVIVLIALVGPEGLGAGSNGRIIFGIVLSVITIAFIGIFMMLERGGSSPSMVKTGIRVLFAIAWVLCACFLTFSGPFVSAGNGYFGAWGGAITSVSAAAATFSS